MEIRQTHRYLLKEGSRQIHSDKGFQFIQRYWYDTATARRRCGWAYNKRIFKKTKHTYAHECIVFKPTPNSYCSKNSDFIYVSKGILAMLVRAKR